MRAHLVSTNALELVIVQHACRRRLVVGKLKLSASRVECWLVKQTVDVKETALFVEIRHQRRSVEYTEQKRRKVSFNA